MSWRRNLPSSLPPTVPLEDNDDDVTPFIPATTTGDDDVVIAEVQKTSTKRAAQPSSSSSAAKKTKKIPDGSSSSSSKKQVDGSSSSKKSSQIKPVGIPPDTRVASMKKTQTAGIRTEIFCGFACLHRGDTNIYIRAKWKNNPEMVLVPFWHT